eukprot:scaffold41244_cov62-Phaeocystis_antarctica.AAC.1
MALTAARCRSSRKRGWPHEPCGWWGAEWWEEACCQRSSQMLSRLSLPPEASCVPHGDQRKPHTWSGSGLGLGLG